MKRHLATLTVLLLLAAPSFAADIYITDATSGGDTGADCANAHSATWFNSNATGGNTYHLCGTFTGTAGSTKLTPPSGSAGNILTVIFETGAVLEAPYWGSFTAGAITLSNKSYVTIDGNNTGIIRNTANGTALANQQYSSGIYLTGSNNITIRNLTIDNVYQNGGSTSDATDISGRNTAAIHIQNNTSNLDIDNNVLRAARAGVWIDLPGTLSDVDIHRNSISDTNWGIVIGNSGSGRTASNIRIYNNEITDWVNWSFPSATYHNDGIIVYCGNGSTLPVSIYNNYIHGTMGAASKTAFVFCTYDGITPPGAVCTIYNNLLVNAGGSANVTPIWFRSGSTGNLVYNNTMVGTNNASLQGIMLQNAGASVVQTTIKNNIISTFKHAIASYNSVTDQVTVSDNNIFYDLNSNIINSSDGGAYYTLAQWRVAGYDLSTGTSDPLFTNTASDWTLQAASPAIDNGADLSATFTTDYVGNTRSVPWDIGAYESGAADATPSAFSFTDVTGAALSTLTTTDPCITVAGIDAGQTPAITISGAGCTFNVDGGAYGSDASTVGLDNVVCLQGTSSASYSTTYPSCTLTIGGVTDTGAPWTVRTGAGSADVIGRGVTLGPGVSVR